LAGLLLAAGVAQAQDRRVPPTDVTFRAADGGTIAGVRCAVPHVDEAELQSVEATLAAHRAPFSAPEAVTTIPAAFHVVRSATSVSQGNVSDQMIADQMAVLNAAYAGTNFQFLRVVTTRTTNSTWHNGCYSSGTERAMKQALAVDPAHTLNIYTCNPSGGILGWAYFPNSYPESHYLHGTVLLHSSLPARRAGPSSQAAARPHAAGHYLGLYHASRGGCNANGHFVADTPDGRDPASGCPTGRDSCRNRAGLDPIPNFMD